MRYNSHAVFQQVAALGKTASFEDVKNIFANAKGRPVERLEIGAGTVYGIVYYTVEPIGGYWLKMEEWCEQTYGPVCQTWKADQWVPTLNGRWCTKDRKFWFRDEADRTMFMLKWA
jgi:hypothetical protein